MKRHQALLAICLLLPVITHAEIYRWVDEQGQVHFSDSATEGASKIKLKGSSSYNSPEVQQPASIIGEKLSNKKNPYTLFEISKPADEATVWDNNGKISVSLNLQPGLVKGHKTAVRIGEKTYTSTSLNYYFDNLDRGTHILEAFIIDSKGRRLTDPVIHTFHLKRHSALLSPKAKADAAARAAETANHANTEN